MQNFETRPKPPLQQKANAWLRKLLVSDAEELASLSQPTKN